MGYDRESFLAGVAAGRNLRSWPAAEQDRPGSFAFTAVCSPDSPLRIPGLRFSGVIDWGDGCREACSTGETGPELSPGHLYPAGGMHRVTLTGKLWGITFDRCGELISVDTPFPPMAAESFDRLFFRCSRLETLPEGLFDGCMAARSFRQAFYGCDGLTELPGGLFACCAAAEDFGECFSGCSGLTELPGDLFGSCGAAGSFRRCFYGCTGLQCVPAGLFAGCGAAEDLLGCFERTALREIPESLFAACPRGRSFAYAFASCPLTGIPAGLFASCTEAEEFTACFSYCGGVTGVPEGLFASCPRALNFSYCFIGCSLTCVPPALFAGNREAVNFRGTFAEETTITGSVPALWDTHPGADGSACYLNCVNAANYGDIPPAWKETE